MYARIEDLREVTRVAGGKSMSSNVKAMIVPGSGLVKEQAEAKGLHRIFVPQAHAGVWVGPVIRPAKAHASEDPPESGLAHVLRRVFPSHALMGPAYQKPNRKPPIPKPKPKPPIYGRA
jgi:Aconitase family (aconitate hydratase)